MWSVLFMVLKTAYPMVYSDYVLKYAEEFDVDSSLVFSVMKNESGFDKNAYSNKDAVGLMQITNKTAKWIADNLNLSDYCLSDPETNIKFSCWYLGYLKGKFLNLHTAIAAYNAGEGNVCKWLKDDAHSIDGVNLFNIPFHETDIYVKKVMNTYKIYEKLY